MQSKTSEFSSEEVWLSEIAKALSHPARIRILKILTELDTCIVGSIVERIPLAQSTVSQHLKELKRVGIIEGEIEGPRTCYCIDKIMLKKAKMALDNLFNNIGCCQ
jgi:DNA-binding transcriptional ArsR family regulator